MATSSQPHATPTLGAGEDFDLHHVCGAASTVACPLCHRIAGTPCTVDAGRGYHVARFGRAMKAGAITGSELIAVLWIAGMFTPETVIEDGCAQ